MPRHEHANEDEVIYVLEGEAEAEFWAAGESVRAAAGSIAFLRKGIPHQFRNAGEKPLRTLIFIVPGGFSRFFEEIDAKSKEGALTPEEVGVGALVLHFCQWCVTHCA
jgi:quercetin dioxygenase-like cupin family protein